MESKKIIYTCLVCGKEKTVYKNPNNAYKYCSKECYYESKKEILVDITCLLCGKVVSVSKVNVDRGQYKYCGNRCRGIAARASEDKVCPICKKIFYKRSKSVTCSIECQSKLHSKWIIEKGCSGSANAFFGKKHTLKTRKHLSRVKKKMFADGILIPFMKGKGNPNKYSRSKDLEWRLFRKSILDRDNNKCVLCSSKKRLEVHHIVPYRMCKKHEESNLITLCRECHKKLYRKELETSSSLLLLVQQY